MLVWFINTIIIYIPTLNANIVDLDQPPRSVKSDLNLRCLPLSLLRHMSKKKKKKKKNKWVKSVFMVILLEEILIPMSYMLSVVPVGNALCDAKI